MPLRRKDVDALVFAHELFYVADNDRGIARDRLEDHGARLHLEPLEFFPDQEPMITVAEQDRCRETGLRLQAVERSTEKSWSCPPKKRMNCFGHIDRDTGRRRVPDPLQKMTG